MVFRKEFENFYYNVYYIIQVFDEKYIIEKLLQECLLDAMVYHFFKFKFF